VVLSAILWWVLLRRMVRVKAERRVTSIADFVSARYDNSQTVAVLATCMALLGSLPYVALQMRSILSTLRVAAQSLEGGSSVVSGMMLEAAGPLLVVFTSVFTILVGVRRLDPTERHHGMVAAVAVESVVKLAALMAVGVYVTWVLYDGVGDIYERVRALSPPVVTGIGDGSAAAYMRWTSLTVLTMWAVLFLPRQFHVAVVENSDENHIRTAMWLFPLYALLLQVFVMPIALGGLAAGLPHSQADTFVLRLPIMNGSHWLAGLAFIGGFSAGMSMIVVSAMTMATMITNHVMLPLAEAVPALRGVRHFILPCRGLGLRLPQGPGRELPAGQHGGHLLCSGPAVRARHRGRAVLERGQRARGDGRAARRVRGLALHHPAAGVRAQRAGAHGAAGPGALGHRAAAARGVSGAYGP